MKLDWTRLEAAARDTQRQGNGPLCAYIYDLQALSEHASMLRAGMPPVCDFFYAIKANSDLPILQTLAPWVDGFEVSSGGEIDWVRRHFPQVQLIFSGPGKLDAELALALQENVVIHVESPHELERLAMLAKVSGKAAQILLRVNPPLAELADTSLVMGGKPTQFGISLAQLPTCLARVKAEPSLQLKGIHLHLVSHQLDAGRHLQLLSTYLRQCRQWQQELGFEIEHINVGGGIGVNYREPTHQFDWATFSRGLTELTTGNNFDSGLRLRFEMGRFVSAFCGYYATEVIDLKQSAERTYAIVRGGTHHFRTPSAQGHSHPFRLLRSQSWPHAYPRPSVAQCRVTVAGQLCTPKDVLASDVEVDCLSAGDLLLFPYAGAYAWHISHHDFLRHPFPLHIYLPARAGDS